MTISMVVAASENNVIGNKGQIPWHLPNDVKFFRNVTKGHPIIMGRKTYESIGRPLPDRKNIVVSRTAEMIDGCTVVTSLGAAIDLASQEPTDEIMIIGGGQIYKEGMEYANKIYMTRVQTVIVGDAVFPEIDPKQWKLVSSESHQADEQHTYAYVFETYEKISTKH